MRLKSATVKDFKRFTDLTVQGIPETARLIMLAGPNGSGKSSFFDALHTWYRWTSRKHQSWEMDYHAKTGSPVRDQWRNDVQLEFHSPEPAPASKKTLSSGLRTAMTLNSKFRTSKELETRWMRSGWCG